MIDYNNLQKKVIKTLRYLEHTVANTSAGNHRTQGVVSNRNM